MSIDGPARHEAVYQAQGQVELVRSNGRSNRDGERHAELWAARELVPDRDHRRERAQRPIPVSVRELNGGQRSLHREMVSKIDEGRLPA